MLPALTLALPSGYAYGIVLLTLCAVATAPHWLRQPMASTSARWLLLVFAVMGVVWLYGGDLSKGWSVLNKPSRYGLAVLCIPFVFAFPPRGRFLLLGIAVGAAAGGFRALYDVHVLGFDRAWTSIRDSNLSTIIICGILFLFGQTPGASIVSGFAVTLALGLVVNLFTAVLATRTFLYLIDRVAHDFIAARPWLMGV